MKKSKKNLMLFVQKFYLLFNNKLIFKNNQNFKLRKFFKNKNLIYKNI